MKKILEDNGKIKLVQFDTHNEAYKRYDDLRMTEVCQKPEIVFSLRDELERPITLEKLLWTFDDNGKEVVFNEISINNAIDNELYHPRTQRKKYHEFFNELNQEGITSLDYVTAVIDYQTDNMNKGKGNRFISPRFNRCSIPGKSSVKYPLPIRTGTRYESNWSIAISGLPIEIGIDYMLPFYEWKQLSNLAMDRINRLWYEPISTKEKSKIINHAVFEYKIPDDEISDYRLLMKCNILESRSGFTLDQWKSRAKENFVNFLGLLERAHAANDRYIKALEWYKT